MKSLRLMVFVVGVVLGGAGHALVQDVPPINAGGVMGSPSRDAIPGRCVGANPGSQPGRSAGGCRLAGGVFVRGRPAVEARGLYELGELPPEGLAVAAVLCVMWAGYHVVGRLARVAAGESSRSSRSSRLGAIGKSESGRIARSRASRGR